jgi:uncharacterized protein YjbI with pentapeptide repeats
MRGASARKVRFLESDLSQAKLVDAKAGDSMFVRAVLEGADFTNLDIEAAVFAGAVGNPAKQ